MRSSNQLAAHAVCAAAGARDGLRVAQFFVRDLSRAEAWGRPEQSRGTEAKTAEAEADFASRLVARLARLADRLLTKFVNLWISLFVPDWRRLPSPFTHGMMGEVAAAIKTNSFVVNPLFNAYFYRAAIHILLRFRRPPFLVLEYRVDSARRALADAMIDDKAETLFLVRVLIALVQAAPIARPGVARDADGLPSEIDPNVSVYATACVALLFAEEGKPVQEFDEDQFFALVATLISPRLPAIATAIRERNEQGLARQLLDIKSMY